MYILCLDSDYIHCYNVNKLVLIWEVVGDATLLQPVLRLIYIIQYYDNYDHGQSKLRHTHHTSSLW